MITVADRDDGQRGDLKQAAREGDGSVAALDGGTRRTSTDVTPRSSHLGQPATPTGQSTQPPPVSDVVPDGYRRRTWLALLLGITALAWWLLWLEAIGYVPGGLPEVGGRPIAVMIVSTVAAVLVLLGLPVWAIVYTRRVCQVRTEMGAEPPGRKRAVVGQTQGWIGLGVAVVVAGFIAGAAFLYWPLDVTMSHLECHKEFVYGVMANEGIGEEDVLVEVLWLAADGSVVSQGRQRIEALGSGDTRGFQVSSAGDMRSATDCRITVGRSDRSSAVGRTVQ